MKRTACALVLLAALGGCLSAERGPDSNGGCANCFGSGRNPMAVPGLQGAWGAPVPVAQPYASSTPPSAQRAHAMLADSMPLNMVQLHNSYAPDSSGILPTGGV